MLLKEKLADRKRSIQAQIASLQDNLKQIEEEEVRLLLQQCVLSENRMLFLLGQAVAHKNLGIKPHTPKLGYAIAEHTTSLFKKEANFFEKSEDKDLYNEICKFLDVTDYIFNHTHYDECNNGFFFRRS